MKFIEVHAHMSSRTTDDYEKLALAGCVAVSEPAFWSGMDRSSVDGFRDYFNHLTDFEVKRAARYNIAHYTWLALNPKEADNREMAGQVLQLLTEFISDPSVLGIGEIGLNKCTTNELKTFTEHAQYAVENNLLMLIHTPHLEDKYKGTALVLEALNSQPKVNPGNVLIDHAEEHTIQAILQNGFWAGLTLYPKTKCSPERAVDMIEKHGTDRILVASACDWGESDPLAIPRLAFEMRRRGHGESAINKIVYDNPISFLKHSPAFKIPG